MGQSCLAGNPEATRGPGPLIGILVWEWVAYQAVSQGEVEGGATFPCVLGKDSTLLGSRPS